MSRKYSQRTNLSRREFLKLGAGASAGLGVSWILAACGQSTTAPTATTAAPAATTAPTAAMPKPETPNFVHGTYNPNWANTVTIELAEEFGWFKEEGVDPGEIIIVDQTQIFPALIGNSLQTAQQDTDAVAGANGAGEPIRFIACYRDKEPWIFGVAKGIETAADLKGKQVSGGAAGSRNEFNGKEMLRRLGLDPEVDVEWVPVGGGSDSRVEAVTNGIIAGTVMFDRHRAIIQEAGGKILYDSLEDFPQDCFCVHENWLSKNERTVIAFLKATTRARIFFHDLNNKDQIISIMEKRGYEFPQSFIDQYERAVAIVSPTGTFQPDAMDKLIADSVKTGSLETAIDWHEFVRMDYLNQAFDELNMPELKMNV